MSCGGSEKPSEELTQAFKLHEEAVSIRNQVADQIAKLEGSTDSLFVEANKSNLDSFRISLNVWNEQLVEVPGFEAAHEHEGHHHDHDEPLDLTPKQHLEVQQHLLSEIKALAESVNQIEQ